MNILRWRRVVTVFILVTFTLGIFPSPAFAPPGGFRPPPRPPRYHPPPPKYELPKYEPWREGTGREKFESEGQGSGKFGSSDRTSSSGDGARLLGAGAAGLTVLSVLPANDKAIAEEPHQSSVHAYYQLPTDGKEYQAIFGTDRVISTRVLAEVQQVKKEFEVIGVHEEQDIVNEETFTRTVERDKAKYLLWVGHNENGNFTFLNGSKIPLKSMIETCGRNGKICIFLACSSAAFLPAGARFGVGIDREITFKEGIEMAEGIKHFISNRNERKEETSAEEIKIHLEKVQRETSSKFEVRYIVLSGFVGTVVMLIIIAAFGDDDDDKRLRQMWWDTIHNDKRFQQMWRDIIIEPQQ